MIGDPTPIVIISVAIAMLAFCIIATSFEDEQ
jgi:hypothetical protein